MKVLAQSAVSAAAESSRFGQSASKSPKVGPDRPTDLRLKKHEKPRKNPKKRGYHNEIHDNNDDISSEDMLDGDEAEDEESVYRKISERRSELNRARRNGDDCHVS